MLNVPERIKELLHTDSVNKNIRIHFPNGERSDICNDLIVQDSVQFKESLCSQDKLKFGLCEAPVFECEVVGVGNIKGATIEVFCEVVCEPTVEGAVWKPDVQKYVYPISYGDFKVTEAKRQADSIYRRITAYGFWDIYNSSFNNDYNIISHYIGGQNYRGFMVEAKNQEIVKELVLKRNNGSMDFDIIKKLYAKLNMLDELVTLGESDISDMWGTQEHLYVDGGLGMDIDVHGALMYQNNPNLYYGEVYPALYTSEEIYQWASDIIDEFIDNNTWYQTNEPYEKLREYLRIYLLEGKNYEKIADDEHLPGGMPLSIFTLNGFVLWDGQNTSGNDMFFTCPIYDNDLLIYPYNVSGNSNVDAAAKVCWLVPSTIYLRDTYNNVLRGLTIRQSNIYPWPFYYSFKKVNCQYFGYTQNQSRAISTIEGRGEYWEPTTSFSGYSLKQMDIEYYQKIWKGYYEIGGLFGYFSRDNKIRVIRLKRLFGLLPSNELYPNNNLLPEGVIGGKILPGDYQTCWYDDEYRKEYGAIKCSYKDSSNNLCDFTLFIQNYTAESDAESYLTYDFSDNEIIKSRTWSQEQIKTICDYIADNLEYVTYMPVEFKGRGLPYVEAGDTFEILTRSNDSITTIVLNRTINGEQHLVDSYKSV